MNPHEEIGETKKLLNRAKEFIVNGYQGSACNCLKLANRKLDKILKHLNGENYEPRKN